MALSKARELVAEARLKPHQQISLLLGNFAIDRPPIGYSVEVASGILKSVASQIRIQESDHGRKFVSYITNNEDKPVNVKIWQL